VALDWFPNANHTGLYLAMERGYFKDEGIALKVYTPDDPATILATVGSDKDEFGFEYQVGVLLARAQGVPVVSIAGIVQHPLNSVMALQESGITRPRDLVGRTVGYPGIATDPPLLRTMLEFDGVPPEQAQAVVDGMVNVGFDLIPALISRRVDAVVGAYWTHESISAQNQGFPVVVMRMEEWGVPDFYELVLVTSEDTLKKRPDVVQRFVRAVVRGYQDAAADPAAAVEVLLRRTGDEVDPAIERPGIKVIAPLWKNGVPVGWQTADRWREFAGWMNANGLLKNPVDGEKAFTNEFVELVD
jgi:putative hydroxymethylpyrimidine transport system substrate-binding protein